MQLGGLKQPSRHTGRFAVKFQSTLSFEYLWAELLWHAGWTGVLWLSQRGRYGLSWTKPGHSVHRPSITRVRGLAMLHTIRSP